MNVSSKLWRRLMVLAAVLTVGVIGLATPVHAAENSPVTTAASADDTPAPVDASSPRDANTPRMVVARASCLTPDTAIVDGHLFLPRAEVAPGVFEDQYDSIYSYATKGTEAGGQLVDVSSTDVGQTNGAFSLVIRTRNHQPMTLDQELVVYDIYNNVWYVKVSRVRLCLNPPLHLPSTGPWPPSAV